MLVCIPIRLHVSPEEDKVLRETLLALNSCTQLAADAAFERRIFHEFGLHRLIYRDLRQKTGLGAQAVVRAIGKATDGYRSNRAVKLRIKALGGFPYDARMLKLTPETVSIWTISGRLRLPVSCHVPEVLRQPVRESLLLKKRGKWYLHTWYEVPEMPTLSVEAALGVDLGLVNIATTSDGVRFGAGHLRGLRNRYRRLNSKLQSNGSRAAKRLLKKRKNREARFATWVNHNISKHLVQTAERTKRAIALEDLTHIRSRIRARKPQRIELHSWAFAQLRRFVSYKAQRAGVPVTVVCPAYTSQTCSSCNHCSRKNRRLQHSFICVACGFAAHADVNAAKNICRVAVSPPYLTRLSA